MWKPNLWHFTVAGEDGGWVAIGSGPQATIARSGWPLWCLAASVREHGQMVTIGSKALQHQQCSSVS